MRGHMTYQLASAAEVVVDLLGIQPLRNIRVHSVLHCLWLFAFIFLVGTHLSSLSYQTIA